MRDLWCSLQRVQVFTKKIKHIPFGENQKKAIDVNLENILKGRDSDRKSTRPVSLLAAGVREKAHAFPKETKNCLKCFSTMPLGPVSYFTCIINYKAFTFKAVPGYCWVFFLLPSSLQKIKHWHSLIDPCLITLPIFIWWFSLKNGISSHSEVTFLFKNRILLQSRNFFSVIFDQMVAHEVLFTVLVYLFPGIWFYNSCPSWTSWKCDFWPSFPKAFYKMGSQPWVMDRF